MELNEKKIQVAGVGGGMHSTDGRSSYKLVPNSSVCRDLTWRSPVQVPLGPKKKKKYDVD